ncbi:ensconsin-like [Astyanax mexicanus]|uniref:ensconsin-like n=1 Tax=Astyanax mexicanus TaxID=7994 RepID=UPI0020CB3A6E|nr:ensconsin-like [Astyanax mexicanus]
MGTYLRGVLHPNMHCGLLQKKNRMAAGASDEAQNRGNSEYKWTDEDTAELIAWRSANEGLFTGRRNAAQKGFEEFIRMRGLTGSIDPMKIKRKWENLKQKYKELKAPRTGVSTEGGEATAASWRWYGLMDEALQRRPSINPPLVVDSSAQDVVVASSPSVPLRQSPTPPSKRRRETELLSFLKAMQDRDEERERACLEREERKEREALEREDRKERERLEREERKEKEWQEREERREREEGVGGKKRKGECSKGK